MKRLLPLVGIAVFILAGAGVYFATHIITDSYLTKEQAARTPEPTVECKTTEFKHVIKIQNSTLNPAHTYANLCDTITVTNNDAANRLMAFGEHDRHQPYDGMTERELRSGESFTFTLNQVGTYLIHDHLEDDVKGSFTVTK